MRADWKERMGMKRSGAIQSITPAQVLKVLPLLLTISLAATVVFHVTSACGADSWFSVPDEGEDSFYMTGIDEVDDAVDYLIPDGLQDLGDDIKDGLGEGMSDVVEAFTNPTGTAAFTGPYGLNRLEGVKESQAVVGFNRVVSAHPSLRVLSTGHVAVTLTPGYYARKDKILSLVELDTRHEHHESSVNHSYINGRLFTKLASSGELENACKAAGWRDTTYPVAVQLRSVQTDDRVREDNETFTLKLFCRTLADVTTIYLEQCPVGYVLEETGEQSRTVELASNSSSGEIKRQRCVRP